MLLLVLLIASIVLVALAYKFTKKLSEVASFITIFFCSIAILAFAFTAINTASRWIFKDSDTAKFEERYESLYNQAYYKMFENENDFGKKELANQITEWNEDLAEYKKLKNNIWLSIMYPIDIDQFNKIPIGLLGETVG